MVTTFLYIASAMVIVFLLYWTYHRFVKITKQDLKPYHKKIWWTLLSITVLASLALVIAYLTQ